MKYVSEEAFEREVRQKAKHFGRISDRDGRLISLTFGDRHKNTLGSECPALDDHRFAIWDDDDRARFANQEHRA